MTGSEAASPTVDVVLSRSEVNNRYGTGILLQRMFPRHRANVVSIRSTSIWDGEQEFGIRQLVIPKDLRRSQIYAWALAHTGDLTIGRVYCVPYRGEEIIAALALTDAHRAPFCLYVMDDQNVASNGISDELMAEAIDKARLRLAISSDMRDAYHAKYGRRFWIAPPTMLVDVDSPPNDGSPNEGSRNGRGILIGNISAQEWMDALIRAMGGSQLRLDWFSNSQGGGYWLERESIAALMGAHIRLCDPLPEPALAALLPNYEVAVVPTMPPRGSYANFAVSSLSFPSRLTFLVVSGDLPVLVVGDEDLCVARFVRHFGLGFTCPYDPAALDHALAATRDPAWRQAHRAAVTHMRRVLGGTDIANWVRDALDQGAPADPIFELLDVHPSRFPPLSVRGHPTLARGCISTNRLRSRCDSSRRQGTFLTLSSTWAPARVPGVTWRAAPSLALNSCWSSPTCHAWRPLRSHATQGASEHAWPTVRSTRVSLVRYWAKQEGRTKQTRRGRSTPCGPS